VTGVTLLYQNFSILRLINISDKPSPHNSVPFFSTIPAMSTTQTPQATESAHASSWLAHFPITLFATIMGTAGLAIAWHKAAQVLSMPHGVGIGLSYVALALFVVLLLGYGAKAVRYPGEVKAEFNHPVRISFFPALSISSLLLSIAFLHVLPGLSQTMWWGGIALHLVFTVVIMSSWIHHSHYQIQHSTPAWFIPVVGNILVPIAGMTHGSAEISWFFFSVGLVFWIVLLTVMMNRFFFHPPVPAKLLPTLFILIAPPAVGFLSYLALDGGVVDSFARVLFYVALFTTLLLFYQIPQFRKVPFFMSWWAYSFPMAAITIASLTMGSKIGNGFLTGLGGALLAVTTALIALLVVLTLKAIADGKVFIPE
jgi:tellurite resistance protein